MVYWQHAKLLALAHLGFLEQIDSTMRVLFLLAFFLLFIASFFAQQPVAAPHEEGQRILASKSEHPKADTILDTWEMIDPLKYPVFPGGEKELMRLIDRNIWWPKEAHYGGTIVVQFTVDTLGDCRDLKILKSPDRCFEPIITTIFSKMPCWIPGEMEGRKVPMKFTLPIRIRLE